MKCPKCGTRLEQDYGVTACVKCQAVLFIDMDGNVQISGDTQDENPPISSVAIEANPSNAQQIDDLSEHTMAPFQRQSEDNSQPFTRQSGELVPQDDAESISANSQPQAPQDFALAESEVEVGAAQSPNPLIENYFENEEKEGGAKGSLSLPDYIVDQDREPLPARQEDPGFGDVLAFANSETATGPLSYTVWIENIDTKEVREAIKDALSDPKLRWDVKEITAHIQDGRLELKNLNPAKASVVVYKLRELPIRIRWRQDVYT